jgi:hypothetical protein
MYTKHLSLVAGLLMSLSLCACASLEEATRTADDILHVVRVVNKVDHMINPRHRLSIEVADRGLDEYYLVVVRYPQKDVCQSLTVYSSYPSCSFIVPAGYYSIYLTHRGQIVASASVTLGGDMSIIL